MLCFPCIIALFFATPALVLAAFALAVSAAFAGSGLVVTIACMKSVPLAFWTMYNIVQEADEMADKVACKGYACAGWAPAACCEGVVRAHGGEPLAVGPWVVSSVVAFLVLIGDGWMLGL